MTDAKISLQDKDYDLPTIVGTENEVGIDIKRFRGASGAVTLDYGFANTASCQSEITFINGEEGILRYRGYAIEELAKHSSFMEVSFLLIYERLPTEAELVAFRQAITYHTLLHEDTKKFFAGFPANAHPMVILSAMVGSLGTYYPDYGYHENTDLNILRLMAKTTAIAALAHKTTVGQPFIYPRNDLGYTENFLRMLFAVPSEDYEVPPVLDRALNLLLILHADHEQNCSTSTVRMVGSSEATLFASISAGISALSGPLHGGANQKVIEMLEMIKRDGGGYEKYVEKAKNKKDEFRLMGFGHRVYKKFDPRAKILKTVANDVLDALGSTDPLLDIARNLEEIAGNDEYFLSRNLYPNVDFYSGIIYRAMGIPTNMFTVMFAIGRLPGWISHWREMHRDPGTRINRPRQIYQGPTARPYVPIESR